MRIVLSMLALMVSVGCGPLALQHGARTAPKGKVAAGGSALIVHEVGQGAAKDSSRTDAGQSAGFVRWGFHEQMDAGVQVYPGGVRGDVKLMLVNEGGLAMSMNPGIHFGHRSATSKDADFESNQTATLTGFDMTFAVAKTFGDTEIWAAPRFGTFTLDSAFKEEDADGDTFEDESTITHRGWGVGFGAKLKMSETLWLVPELGVYQRETKTSGQTDRGLSWVPAIGFATGF